MSDESLNAKYISMSDGVTLNMHSMLATSASELIGNFVQL